MSVLQNEDMFWTVPFVFLLNPLICVSFIHFSAICVLVCVCVSVCVGGMCVFLH